MATACGITASPAISVSGEELSDVPLCAIKMRSGFSVPGE